MISIIITKSSFRMIMLIILKLLLWMIAHDKVN